MSDRTRITSFRKSEMKSSYHGLIIKILKAEGKAMRRKDIVNKILGMKDSKGKTPEKSIQVVLRRSKHIRRVKRGYYEIK